MMRTLCRSLLLASAVACPAAAQPVVPAVDPHGLQPHQIVAAQASARAAVTGPATPAAGSQGAVPTTMPPKIDPVALNRPLTRKALINVEVARHWINRFQRPRLDADGVEHFRADRGQVQVVTAVDHITDIALAPGEIIAPPLHIGDAADWRLHPAVSGSGSRIISHILLKPDDAGLDTNLVIETSKRTISVELVSRRADYMPLVSLDLPDADEVNGPGGQPIPAGYSLSGLATNPCDQPPAIGPQQFRITGAHASWRPTQVWVVATPVGYKTCIELPADIGSGDLPALLALGDDGGWFSSPSKQLISVRFTGRRYVADELLNRFVLIAGVGSDQRRVIVRRVQ
jgi:type IV secretion system protein VirB9